MKRNRFLGFLRKLLLTLAFMLAIFSIGSVLWLYFDGNTFLEIFDKFPMELKVFLRIDLVFVTPAITLISLLIAGHKTRRREEDE